jgi:DNA (cytosine-5)-methyltransferase 1
MNHLGDITKINGAAAPIVDCVIGGSPCQDLSIAGKRAGLAGKRSGLYMEQIRVIREMREHDRANGRSGEFIRPRYMVWENVPGAFSSNHGKDFAAVLEEAVRVIEPEAPPVPVPEKGWPTSGCLMGDRWSVAWRVLDAKFWGVPQTRRRIALVADFGGQSAPEILFVRKGVPGHSEPGGTAGKGLAGGAESGTSFAVRIRGGCDGGGKGALVQTEVSGTLGCKNDQTVFCLQGNGIDRADTARCNGKGWKEDVCYTLNTIDRPAVCAGFKLGNSEKARSIGYCEERAPTLNAECGGNKPAILDMSHACDVIRDCGGTSPSLQARMGTGGNQVPLVAYGIGNGQVNEAATPAFEKAQTLNTMHDAQAVFCQDVAHTLKAKANLDFREDSETYPVQSGKVRRMTPLECERLQGFPDGWTDIGEWVDSKGKTHKKSSDSSRYKALGNSIALPPWKWVLKRICAQYERDATMASLFDGIGGFPLIWEQLNGKGSCLWASEIEEFPMAVTRKHFG